MIVVFLCMVCMTSCATHGAAHRHKGKGCDCPRFSYDTNNTIDTTTVYGSLG
ncbi:MAG: hypothetical protein LBQ64_06785 [Bacteroidales bacterium]|nr:hypothetical protein [Bacteroidales bacterium]